ncbi:MAG: ribonuclease HII [Pseudomonadota bacterium]
MRASDPLPDLSKLAANSLVVGVDEVGRGPLAGDVVAAAVALDPNQPIAGLADSKTLSEEQRESRAAEIETRSRLWALGRASPEEIDEINILQASLLAMARAVAALPHQPDFVLVDGRHLPKWPYPSCAVIKGDARVDAIAAASIIAKVSRDTSMYRMHERWPEYGFDSHKGYPTARHLAALQEHGPCAIHRQSFGPVKNLR